MNVARHGAVTVDLLRRLLGLCTDNLAYRWEAFGAVGALDHFVEQHKDDLQHRVRSLPGPVRSELLLLAALSSLLDVNLRAGVSEVVKVTTNNSNSSLDGAFAVGSSGDIGWVLVDIRLSIKRPACGGGTPSSARS